MLVHIYRPLLESRKQGFLLLRDQRPEEPEDLRRLLLSRNIDLMISIGSNFGSLGFELEYVDEADKTRIYSWRMRREKRMKKRQEVGHSGWGVFHLTSNSKGSAVVDVSLGTWCIFVARTKAD